MPHSPEYIADDASMLIGTRAMLAAMLERLMADYKQARSTVMANCIGYGRLMAAMRDQFMLDRGKETFN